ncbi:hypothetical protein QFC19_001924 [Naganishia cerealis]|uniref:Uncharacterized protein n=1 Tax=Naganishia cerealis TaxID=610337 RepID=A0ACC2WET1_9TREE|nr:hypothetical protein QFC19_001924 [Naganishia cerealis]
MADAKLFTRSKAQELRAELQAADRKDKGYLKKKTALKKVVANMTMGNDSQYANKLSIHDAMLMAVLLQCLRYFPT